MWLCSLPTGLAQTWNRWGSNGWPDKPLRCLLQLLVNSGSHRFRANLLKLFNDFKRFAFHSQTEYLFYQMIFIHSLTPHSYFESVFFFFLLLLINFQHRWFRFKCFLWLKRLLLLVVSATNAHSIEFYWQQYHIGLKNCKTEATGLIGRLYTCFFPSWPEIQLFEHFGIPIGIRPMKQQGKVANSFSCGKSCLKKQSPQLANKRQDTKKHKVIARNSDMGTKSTNRQSNWFSLVNTRFSFY